ncbi:hypothetical protein PN497_08965 [Sphaerospermopsis kisseleviana CS-549]|uniref:Uncharacterized protein n=1 Tax=Sphaerospermopsis kisseleviana CS-549 TaxID=3021783 RepID=A0ABT4ZRT5_9CYAN|nr:hypothetical protein [Sphaerospermopsis kisseleviana]MDB9441488.1 hypothetical protein [Sphaerospermopsis kisseleviana CS-549]BAZ83740.1 hypothetical protein NIES73_50290 [Sphaerospermopsis kisseleviana NIES-73]
MSKIENQQIVDADIEADDNDADVTTSFTETDVVNVAFEKEDRFDFDSNTIILGIQILPANQHDLRQVFITAGIKGEPPVMQVSTLHEIEEYPVIAGVLTKLKAILPQIAEKTQQKEAQKQKISVNQSENNKIVNPPDLPPTNPQKTNPSNQLTLF